jgi:hypothetical protein
MDSMERMDRMDTAWTRQRIAWMTSLMTMGRTGSMRRGSPVLRAGLFRINQSLLDDSDHLYCDRCPVRIDVAPYGPVHEQIERSLVLVTGDEGDA